MCRPSGPEWSALLDFLWNRTGTMWVQLNTTKLALQTENSFCKMAWRKPCLNTLHRQLWLWSSLGHSQPCTCTLLPSAQWWVMMWTLMVDLLEKDNKLKGRLLGNKGWCGGQNRLISSHNSDYYDCWESQKWNDKMEGSLEEGQLGAWCKVITLHFTRFKCDHK